MKTKFDLFTLQPLFKNVKSKSIVSVEDLQKYYFDKYSYCLRGNVEAYEDSLKEMFVGKYCIFGCCGSDCETSSGHEGIVNDVKVVCDTKEIAIYLDLFDEDEDPMTHSMLYEHPASGTIIIDNARTIGGKFGL